MKKILVVLLSCLFLTACGNAVSQEEYDAVVKERDELKKEVENIDSALDISKKSTELKARIEEQYKHAEFVLAVSGKVSGVDVSEAEKTVKELYDSSVLMLDVVLKSYSELTSYTEFDKDVYDSAISTIETVEKSWGETYQQVVNLEKAFE